MKIETQIKTIHALERSIYCTTDAVLHKAMQEGLELVEALQSNNHIYQREEIADAVTNILSVYTRITGIYELDIVSTIQTSDINFTIQLGKWNDCIQKRRGIYARDSINNEQVSMETMKLLGMLGYFSNTLDIKFDIADILNNQIQKFQSRIRNYTTKPIDIKSFITNVPNYPKPGIMFKNIGPLLRSPEAFGHIIHRMASQMEDVDVIAGLDARGFIFGAAIAQYLSKPFIMIRKKGKLSGICLEDSYNLEYGSNVQTIELDSLKPGEKVAIVDDLLATGGTIQSAKRLIEGCGAIVQGCHVCIELEGLHGKDYLDTPVHSIIKYK